MGRRGSRPTRAPIRPPPPSCAAGSTRTPAARGWDARSQDLRDGHRGRDPERQSRTRSRPSRRRLPELFGGAADLSESNLTDVKGEPNFSAETPAGTCASASASTRWAAIANGIAYHGGFIPYCATFLTFSDYMRGAVRLAALAGLHVIYVWTHDSVGLGEDGPTHQPVEHYAALRAIPNLWFVRPGDANETAAAWALAVERRDGPVALALTRQKLPTLRGHGPAGARRRRPRRLRPARGGGRRSPELILIGTGSELQLAYRGRGQPSRRRASRRASCRCRAGSAFDLQDQAYRDAVLPPGVRKRVSVEIGVSLGWERWVGDEGAIIGLDHFGASAPAGTIFEHFGFTADRVADVARRVVRDGLHGRIPTVDGGHFGQGGHPTLAAGESGRRPDPTVRPRPLLTPHAGLIFATSLTRRGWRRPASRDRTRATIRSWKMTAVTTATPIPRTGADRRRQRRRRGPGR